MLFFCPHVPLLVAVSALTVFQITAEQRYEDRQGTVIAIDETVLQYIKL